MKRLLPLAGLFLLLFSLSAQPNQVVSGELIVLLEPEISLQNWLAGQDRPPAERIYGIRTLSRRMNLHLIGFDAAKVEGEMLLKIIQGDPSVLLAQFNHLIQARRSVLTQPDDPNFGTQWALENTGQTGGFPDADIDATEAWDLSTGGPSALGDTIVVAVIDEGFDLLHEDLVYWKNVQEIPGNGLDDDQNGYVDDVQGWNAYNQNGTLPSSVHGTHVAGIIGATGNNNKGVSGVNWSTQILPIAGSSGNEATVLEAYGYALELRRQYQESNGQQGAFVVASNSSFGVDFGQPTNYPIWCAMYDSLGQAGILNAVATMNTASDVDVTGDMPSTCGSDFIIAVTNTTASDQKNPGSAYGLTHIDLGAPGTQVLSTFPSQGYGSLTGTSMATPHVAGAISLLVAASCPGLMIRYRNQPGEVALLYKELILQSVDPLVSLQNFTKTGGRLNLYQSLLQLQDSCDSFNSGCLPPYQLTGEGLTDTSATLAWQQVGSVDDFWLRYRVQGQSSWSDSLLFTSTNVILSGLLPCTDYEFQVRANCGLESSEYLGSRFFQTEGCCEAPTSLDVSGLQASSAFLSWPEVYGSTQYFVRYRTIGSSNWEQLSPTLPNISLDFLTACTSYEVQLATQCDTVQHGFSPSFTFTTSGCGACLDLPYCPAEGQNVAFEWIQAVRFGPIDNISGKNGGYGDFTGISYQFSLDSTYQISLLPGYDGPPFSEQWRIWVDLNQDGIFQDSTELLYDPGAVTGEIQDFFSFPPGSPGGSTRMRIAMKFPGFGTQVPPEACGPFGEGEVEDYCITLTTEDSVFCQVPSGLFAQRLPASNQLAIFWQSVPGASQYLVRWSPINGGSLQVDTVSGTELVLSNLPSCQEYRFAVQALCSAFGSGYSESFTAFSPGCGACLDQTYCTAEGQSADNEWIQGVRFGGFSFQSGLDQGYGDYRRLSIEGVRGDSLELQLWPGFATTPRGMAWSVWADWNQNGDFEAGEQVFATLAPNTDTVGAWFIIPATALGGNTRLRILMGRDAEPDVCTGPVFGEVEEYCLRVNYPDSREQLSLPSVRVFPNPFSQSLKLESNRPLQSAQLRNLLGQVVAEQSFSGPGPYRFSLPALPAGVYLLTTEVDGQQVFQKLLKQ